MISAAKPQPRALLIGDDDFVKKARGFCITAGYEIFEGFIGQVMTGESFDLIWITDHRSYLDNPNFQEWFKACVEYRVNPGSLDGLRCGLPPEPKPHNFLNPLRESTWESPLHVIKSPHSHPETVKRIEEIHQSSLPARTQLAQKGILVKSTQESFQATRDRTSVKAWEFFPNRYNCPRVIQDQIREYTYRLESDAQDHGARVRFEDGFLFIAPLGSTGDDIAYGLRHLNMSPEYVFELHDGRKCILFSGLVNYFDK